MIYEGQILTEHNDLPACIISPITVKLTRDKYIEDRCHELYMNINHIKLEINDNSDKDVDELKDNYEPTQLKNEELTIKTNDLDDE